MRGIDVRSVYLERLEADTDDEAMLISIAELRHPDDRERIVRSLRDRRTRVRAAALPAAAALAPEAAKAVALLAQHEGTGRETRAAASVLRGLWLGPVDHARLEAAVLDATRPWGARMRALSLLRDVPWRHLALLLRLRAEEARPPLDNEITSWLHYSAKVRRSPPPEVREVIVRNLGTLDDERRRILEFILRATT